VGDCWYNCTFDDIAGDDKKQRLRKVLFSAFSRSVCHLFEMCPTLINKDDLLTSSNATERHSDATSMLLSCCSCMLIAKLDYWQALGQTVEWFRKALAVEPVKGNLRLSGYSACGQDGGVQLPHAYIEGNLQLQRHTCVL
jgi:hypothetical protein